nr:MAG TPA: hypothetical protein [Caudoviricetes sp.]
MGTINIPIFFFSNINREVDFYPPLYQAICFLTWAYLSTTMFSWRL